MNQRAMIQLEVEKSDGRIFTFLMPIGAPFGECYDAAMECAAEVLKMAKTAQEQAEQQMKPGKPVIEMTAEQFQDAINKANPS